MPDSAPPFPAAMACLVWAATLLLAVGGARAEVNVTLTNALCVNATQREQVVRRCYEDNQVTVTFAGNVNQGNAYSTTTSFFRQHLKEACRDVPKLMRAFDCADYVQRGCSSPANDLYILDHDGMKKGMDWICSNVQEATFDCLERVFSNSSCQLNLTTSQSTVSLHDALCKQMQGVQTCMVREAAACGDSARTAMATYFSYQTVPGCLYIPSFTAPTPENCSDAESVTLAVQQCYDDQGVTTTLPNVTGLATWNLFLFTHLHQFPTERECRNLRSVQNAVACAGEVLRGCMVAGYQFQWSDPHRLGAGIELFCKHWDEINPQCITAMMPSVYQCTAAMQFENNMFCTDHYTRLCQARYMACCGPASARLMVKLVDFHLNDVCATGAYFVPPRPDYLAHAVCPQWQQPDEPVAVCEDYSQVTAAVTKCYSDRGLTFDLSGLSASGFWIDMLLQRLMSTSVSRDCSDKGGAELALSCALSQVKWCYPPQQSAAFPSIGRLMEASRFFCLRQPALGDSCVTSRLTHIAECQSQAQNSGPASGADYCRSYAIQKACATKHLACCPDQARLDFFTYLDFRRPPSCSADVMATVHVTVGDVRDECNGAQSQTLPRFVGFVLTVLVSVCVLVR